VRERVAASRNGGPDEVAPAQFVKFYVAVGVFQRISEGRNQCHTNCLVKRNYNVAGLDCCLNFIAAKLVEDISCLIIFVRSD